jgi:putative membrane-bound dehydrogenase-like protein
MRRHGFCRFLAASSLAILAGLSLTGGEPPQTGPDAEKRFPPLQVPVGFKATLFACDPLIEYPSAIAPGPRSGSLFVAVDYMTGLGTEIIRHDEVRLVEDTDGDGYADKGTVFADGFNSIQGLAYHGGTVYVMHAPYLTAVRDTKNTGKADERRDLLTGLGLPPEKDPIRLHNANGVVAGHDGWLYLALGDHGCDVKRPEGDQLVLEGGGVLRCRPDGSDLHIFATGLRNIYDVALDEELNVLLRDNENDGGDYKIRVCHSFFGADHGYPYLYSERPEEALPPLADLGLGSSAGGLCYLEQQFPAEYHGNLFFCEWGRAVVRYSLRRSGAAFAPVTETDFAAGAADDPYGFKPTDLVVDRDGSLFVADWADGQRPRRGRGRIYNIRPIGPAGEKPTARPKGRDEPADLDQLLVRLDSESYSERCQAQEGIERSGKDGLASVVAALDKKRLGVRGRLHAVWVVAKVGGPAMVKQLFALAKADPEPRVQAQAIRAIADLTDPGLVKHRIGAGAGDAAIAKRLAFLGGASEPQVLLEIVIALGRLRWPDAPAWLAMNVKLFDPTLAHAAQQTLRRAGNWPAVLKLLDEPSTEPTRAIALRAVADQYEASLVDSLIDRLRRETDATRRREYADALTRVCKKPASPWTYWGFRPPPRPANTVAWERTEAIEQALRQALADPDKTVRRDVLRRMVREKIPAPMPVLGRWLEEERQPDSVAAILAALGERPAAESRPHLESVIREREHAAANRLLAVALFTAGLDAPSQERLLTTAEAVEDGPILAELLRAIGKRHTLQTAGPLLLRKATSLDAEVRAAAVTSLADLEVGEAGDRVRKLLDDPDARVRSAAALAAGKLALGSAALQLRHLARDAAAEVRRSCLEALRRLRDPGALPVVLAALSDRETALKALDYLGELGGPEQVKAVTELTRREPSVEVLNAVGKVLTGWAAKEGLTAAERQEIEHGLSEIHGVSGVLLGWHVRGPFAADAAADLIAKLASGQELPTGKEPARGWRRVLSAGLDARISLGPGTKEDSWLGCCEITVPEVAQVEFMTSSSGLETIWLNGKEAFRRDRPGITGPYPDRFEATLGPGTNRVLVRLSGVKEKAEFQLRFRRKSATAEQERLARAALSRGGNPERGRQLFLNAEKSLCLKCHRVGDQGERVGPDLTGLGSRFSKVAIVESILEPSRVVSPSFETTTVTLTNGKVLSGLKVAETETSITLVDNLAQKQIVAKADIDAQRKQPTSTMPDGLEKRLTEEEFVDLISFLVNLKEPRGQ